MLLAHPNLPTCDECSEWMYNTETWQRNKGHGGFVRRPRGSKLPCKRCPKCEGEKEASPEVGKRSTLAMRNYRTLRLYHEHQAAGGEVTDAIMRKNFGIIRQITDLIDRSQRRALIEMMAMPRL